MDNKFPTCFDAYLQCAMDAPASFQSLFLDPAPDEVDNIVAVRRL